MRTQLVEITPLLNLMLNEVRLARHDYQCRILDLIETTQGDMKTMLNNPAIPTL